MFEIVKELADKKGMNVKELATKLGFSENYFYSLKRGVTIPSDKLQLIADFFGVSTDFLLGRSNELPIDNNTRMLAAHIEDDVTEEEMEEIMRFIDFIRSKRK